MSFNLVGADGIAIILDYASIHLPSLLRHCTRLARGILDQHICNLYSMVGLILKDFQQLAFILIRCQKNHGGIEALSLGFLGGSLLQDV